MKKSILTLLTLILIAVSAEAQSKLKKVYDETLDQKEQIDNAIAEADKENKFVICQVGGNWCKWCLLFAEYISSDEEIDKTVNDNFVYIHVNHNPKDKNASLPVDVQKRLGNPLRFGFPVLVVLDSEGNLLHIQDSSFLEEGNGYDKAKVMRFFRNWTPDAVGR